jgi:hypothetical protein
MVFGLKPMRVASSLVLRRTFGSWLSKRCCFDAVSISLFFAPFSGSLGWRQARPSATPDTSPDVSNAAALPVPKFRRALKRAEKSDVASDAGELQDLSSARRPRPGSPFFS